MKQFWTKKIVVSCFLLLFLAGPALAQQPTPPPTPPNRQNTRPTPPPPNHEATPPPSHSAKSPANPATPSPSPRQPAPTPHTPPAAPGNKPANHPSPTPPTPSANVPSPTPPTPPAKTETTAKKTSEKHPTRGRMLNGHGFTRSLLSPWPFPSTYFGISLGGGAVIAKLDAVTDLTVLALAPAVDLGIGILDWVGIQLAARSGFATGSNLESAIGFGALFNLIFEGRLVVRLYRCRYFYLGVAGQGGYYLGKWITPLQYIATIKVDQQGNLSSDTTKLLQDLSSWNLGPALLFALAPLPYLGLQGSFAYGFEQSSTNGQLENIHGLEASVGLTLNFAGLTSYFPLALPVFYKLSIGLVTPTQLEHRMEFGLVYNGRENFDLGVSFALRLDSQNLQEYLGVVRMYYHW